jgi:hypothetical protein
MPTDHHVPHDHVVIPLPANFAVIAREALATWQQQVRANAIISERQFPSFEQAQAAAEAALYDEMIRLAIGNGAKGIEVENAIEVACRALERRRELFGTFRRAEPPAPPEG